jgi:hypothetical protein
VSIECAEANGWRWADLTSEGIERGGVGGGISTGKGFANRMDIFFEGIDLTMHIDSLILLRL